MKNVIKTKKFYLSHLKSFKIFSFLLLSLITTINSFAYELLLYYEYPIFDNANNIIGYRKVQINSPLDLSPSNPWYSYLNIPIDTHHTIYTYAKEIAKLLNKPLKLTCSDSNVLSYSEKKGDFYNIKLCKHVTNYLTTNSKKFVFLHEIGHIAMLNAYPPYYNFSGLSYGADNLHFIDEILPNYNTAWIEGWANAFAAQKNNGRVFNIDITKLESLGFLQNHTFEEMNRNELFIGKIIYDCITQIPNGKGKVFTVMANSGPHYSLKDFIKAYVKFYPEDQVEIAKILNINSFQKISLQELLEYVNDGSNVVTPSFYNFLVQNNKLTPISNNSNSSSQSQRASIFEKISSWLSKLFKWFETALSEQYTSRNHYSVSQPAILQNESQVRSIKSYSNSYTNSTTTAINFNITNINSITSTTNLDEITTTISQATSTFSPTNSDLATQLANAYEEYQAALVEYSKLCTNSKSNTEAIKRAKEKLDKAKSKVKSIKAKIK